MLLACGWAAWGWHCRQPAPLQGLLPTLSDLGTKGTSVRGACSLTAGELNTPGPLWDAGLAGLRCGVGLRVAVAHSPALPGARSPGEPRGPRSLACPGGSSLPTKDQASAEVGTGGPDPGVPRSSWPVLLGLPESGASASRGASSRAPWLPAGTPRQRAPALAPAPAGKGLLVTLPGPAAPSKRPLPPAGSILEWLTQAHCP